MKCKLIRDAMCENHEFSQEAFNKARELGQFYDVPQFVPVAAGTIIKDPRAFMLVRMGMAEPADDECRIRAARTPEQIAAAVKAQDRVSKGIAPEDTERYDRGEMLGYNPDGTDIKGPNWAEYNDPTEDDLFDNEGEEDDDE